jgi:hypothetical protein
MSKKLIAVAAAAALALTGLVATPASAANITKVAITTSASGTSTTDVASHADKDEAVTAATAMTSRSLDYTVSGNTTRNVVRFDVTTNDATSLTITSTGTVKVIAKLTDAAGDALKVDAGSQKIDATTITGALTYTFYAWTTSTTAGTVVVETPGTKRTYYVKSLAGAPYNITNVTWPTVLTSGQSDNTDNANNVTWNVTDVFGNTIAADHGVLAGFSSAGNATFGAQSYDTVAKVSKSKVTGTLGSSVSLSLSLTAPDYSLNGWPKPVKSVFTTISAGDLATQVTNLTAQVTALNAQVVALQAQLEASRPKATSVTKKRFNTLARKWNAANPGSRVALKK